jgi:5-methylcytosine-specific restriction protein B
MVGIPNDIREVKNKVSGEIGNATSAQGLTVKSWGTKLLELTAGTDTKTGYWSDPASLSSKAPRWIVHLEETPKGWTAAFAKDAAGKEMPSARNGGAINNNDGKCIAAALRVMPAIKKANGRFEFPDWEWLLVLGFTEPLTRGTSSDSLSAFNATAGTIEYGGKNNVANIAIRALVECPHPAGGFAHSYEEASVAIADLFGPGKTQIFRGTDPGDCVKIAELFKKIPSISVTMATPKTVLPPLSALVGIPASVYAQINASLAAGKRHFILWGPPGTGKTTLAEHMARQFANPDESTLPLLLTASSSWSSQDLIGGYQPLGPGKMGFIPGAMLRHFDRPIVIDELNRCPIDKVIGPMFSILSGQPTTLPYRVNVEDPNSAFYSIQPVPKAKPDNHEFCPTPFWMLICTLNTIDKAQLGQMSYALCRRFAWIKIGVPDDLNQFVVAAVEKESPTSRLPDAGDPNPIAEVWEAINTIRPLGGAPFLDLIRAATHMTAKIDLFKRPAGEDQETLLNSFQMTLLPLLDGISRHEADTLTEKIGISFGLSTSNKAAFGRELADQAI